MSVVPTPALAGIAGRAPRQVFCVIDAAHRDLAVARAVLEGRFTHAGQTVELGLEPDWAHAQLPADPEWMIEWSKLYWSLDLAHAYTETRDAAYLRAWKRLLRTYLRGIPGQLDRSYVAARRIQSLIYAWNRFARAGASAVLSEELGAELVASLAAEARAVRRRLTPARNHRTIELYALLVFALAFPEEDAGGALLDDALGELTDNLLTDVRPDGVHCEASTHYHLIALRSYLGTRENARRFGLDLPAAYDERLEAACDFALHCHRPDGSIPALSDADTGGYLELLELADALLDRPDLLYAATGGREGQPPGTRHASFPDGGYYVQRSGWGENGASFEAERFLVLDCGPLGEGGHGHYDLLSVEIAAGGAPLVVDPGRYTYAEGTPNLRHWFKGTAAHNTVSVDGLDQTPYRRGRPKGPVAQGRLLARQSEPGLDVLFGEARSPLYAAVHRRRAIFVADEYWLIEDDLRGEQPHSYDLRFHLSSEAWGEVALVERPESTLVRAPGVAIVVHGGAVSLEPGWVSPEYGVKRRAPVVRASSAGVDAHFLTLVLPRLVADPDPSLEVAGSAASELKVTVQSGGSAGTADRLSWRHATPVAWRREPSA